MKYAFMREHEQEFRLRSMCRVFDLHPSGYYAWLASPLSERGKDDLRVLGLIKHSWLERKLPRQADTSKVEILAWR